MYSHILCIMFFTTTYSRYCETLSGVSFRNKSVQYIIMYLYIQKILCWKFICLKNVLIFFSVWIRVRFREVVLVIIIFIIYIGIHYMCVWMYTYVCIYVHICKYYIVYIQYNMHWRTLVRKNSKQSNNCSQHLF